MIIEKIREQPGPMAGSAATDMTSSIVRQDECAPPWPMAESRNGLHGYRMKESE
jgi:hypothetical protein